MSDPLGSLHASIARLVANDELRTAHRAAPLPPPQSAPTHERPKHVEFVRNEHNEITRVVERSATRTWDVIRDDTRQFTGLREVEAKD